MILSLLAKLGIDGRGFKAGLKEAEVAANKFAGNLKSQLAAAFGAAAIIGFLKNLADTVGRIKDLGDQYGITTDEIQRADVALKQNGLQFENLGQSLQKIGQARRDAVEGNDELRDSFKRYGLSLNDLNNPQLRNYDLILRIASAIKDQNLTARDQVELTDLLGHRSLKLLSTLQELHKFDTLKIFTEEDVQKIDRANKKLEELYRRLQVFAAESITAAPEFRLRDIFTSLFTEEFLQGIGIDSTADPSKNAPPLTSEQIAEAQAKKYFQIYQGMEEAANPENAGLFEVDKKDKKTKTAAALKFDVDRPGGFGAGAGLSKGFINAFDPRMVVAEAQLAALQSIKTDVTLIKSALQQSTGGSGYE